MIQDMSGATLACYIGLRLYESVMFCLILNATLDKRFPGIVHSIIVISALTVLQTAKGLLPKPSLYASVALNCLPDFLIACLFYKGKFSKRVMYTAYFYASMFVGDAVSFILTVILGAASFEPIDSIENIPYIVALLSRAVMPLCNLALRKLHRECRDSIVRPSLIIPFPLLICALLLAFFPVEKRSLFNTAPMLFFASLVMMLIMLTVFTAALIRHRVKEKQLRDELECRAAQERDFSELFTENKRLEGIFHDMAFHIEYITNTADAGYLETLKERIRGSLINTGNEIVNTILFGKGQKAVESGTKLEISGGLPDALPWIEPVDLHIVLGNALDNAIEAVARLEPGQREPITVRFTCKGSMLVIRIINRASLEHIDLKSFASTKAAPGHGYGMKNIQAVLDMYDGYMETDAVEGYFKLSVMLQRPE